jgi:hypothetical protein
LTYIDPSNGTTKQNIIRREWWVREKRENFSFATYPFFLEQNKNKNKK